MYPTRHSFDTVASYSRSIVTMKGSCIFPGTTGISAPGRTAISSPATAIPVAGPPGGGPFNTMTRTSSSGRRCGTRRGCATSSAIGVLPSSGPTNSSWPTPPASSTTVGIGRGCLRAGPIAGSHPSEHQLDLEYRIQPGSDAHQESGRRTGLCSNGGDDFPAPPPPLHGPGCRGRQENLRAGGPAARVTGLLSQAAAPLRRRSPRSPAALDFVVALDLRGAAAVVILRPAPTQHECPP